jgi:HSP20 family protein
MDRAFRGFAPAGKLEPWAPAVDIQQCDGDIVVTAELPGLKKEDVKVELTEDALIIQGERKQEHKEDQCAGSVCKRSSSDGARNNTLVCSLKHGCAYSE